MMCKTCGRQVGNLQDGRCPGCIREAYTPKEKRVSVLYIRDLPTDVKAQFKAHCAARGKTMREVIIHFMKDKIRKEKH